VEKLENSSRSSKAKSSTIDHHQVKIYHSPISKGELVAVTIIADTILA
jgi:hypothetical protein